MSRRSALAVVVLVACGGSSGKSPADAPAADAPPGSDGLSSCTADAQPRAMLVAISANDVVDLYTMTPRKLTATGVHLTGISKPSQIVMRDDGLEALVVYGGYGSPFGVAAITLMPDGSSAQVEQVLQIGTDSTALSVAYSDHDHAVVALTAMQDEVVGIARQGGTWVAGTRVPAPADYPLAVARRPNSSDVLFSRSQVGVDQTLDIYRLQMASNGTWTSAGAHASVPDYPISMAVHPSGNALYVPTGDPQNPPGPMNLEAPGLMHAVTIGAASFTDAGTVALPRIGSLVAIDPAGRFLVTEGNVYMLDGNGNPNVYAYTFQTVQLAADGSLGQASASDPPKDGLLFDDLEIAPTGHLVAARELYAGSVPPDQQYPLELWAQPQWGAWQLCDTALISGGAHVAIAP